MVGPGTGWERAPGGRGAEKRKKGARRKEKQGCGEEKTGCREEKKVYFGATVRDQFSLPPSEHVTVWVM